MLRTFARNRLALLGLTALLALVFLSSLAPRVAPADPTRIELKTKLASPGRTHWMGTDHFGRDVMSRVLHGGRVSLSVGLIVVTLVLLLGVPLGLVSGYIGGVWDNVLMRAMDAFMTFPPLLLAIAIMGTLGPDLRNAMLALALVNTPTMARLVRGTTLTVREELYVESARGRGHRR